MDEYVRGQLEAATAAAEAGDAQRMGQVLSHLRREGVTEAELSKVIETIGNKLLGGELHRDVPGHPQVLAVLRAFWDVDAEREADDSDWLAGHGIGAETSRRAGYDHPPAFADAETEALLGGVQRVWDEVVRSGEEPSTSGAFRVAQAMTAHGEIGEGDVEALLDLAVDEKYEPAPWGEWLQRAHDRVERERDTEAG